MNIYQARKWPESIMSFQGCPDANRFEAMRDDLLPLNEDPLA